MQGGKGEKKIDSFAENMQRYFRLCNNSKHNSFPFVHIDSSGAAEKCILGETKKLYQQIKNGAR